MCRGLLWVNIMTVKLKPNNPINNLNCDHSHCKDDDGEVKIFPVGDTGNVILCEACYDRIIFNYVHDALYRGIDIPPPWSHLTIYNPTE